MKVVITGSSGSVGGAVVDAALSLTSHTLLLLDKNPPAKAISDPRVEFRTVDLLDYDAFLAALQGAGGLIHLAAYPGNRGAPPATIHNTNVSMSYNALQAAADAGVKKVVIASSVNAIGGVWGLADPTYDYFPIDEDHPCRTSDPYSLSKRIAELQGDAIARAYPEMTISSLRFHAVFPHKPPAPDWADDPKARKDLWGHTTPESAGRACMLALEAEWKGHEAMFIIDDAHRAEGRHAHELVQQHYPTAGIRGGSLTDKQSMYSNAKAERLLGWRPVGGKMPSTT